MEWKFRLRPRGGNVARDKSLFTVHQQTILIQDFDFSTVFLKFLWALCRIVSRFSLNFHEYV